MENLDRIKKLLGFRKNKDLAIFNELSDINSELQTVTETFAKIDVNNLDTLKGEPGNDGHTPTDVELLALIKPLIPTAKSGKDGKTPSESQLLALIRPLIPEVRDGATPTDERLLGLIRPLIPDPKNGIDGKDGSPDTATQVRDKLESLDGEERLDAFAIKNLPEMELNPVTKKYYFGGGGGNKWTIGSSPTPGGTLTVSASQPSNPVVGDLWVDIS